MRYSLEKTSYNLFITTSDTIFAKYCEEVLSLGEKFPNIYKKISHDQDVHAKNKKLERMLDRQYEESKTLSLPGLDTELKPLSIDEIELDTGRPRMAAELVFLFSLLRGFYGSVTDCNVSDRFKDSMTLYILLDNLNIKLPAPTTILENVNALSNETRDYIFTCQLDDVFTSKADDFSYAIFDSTSVSASSCWPTDARIIYQLLDRVFNYGQKFEGFGIQPIPAFYMPNWLKILKELLFKINNTKGTKKIKKKDKVKPLYNDYLIAAHKAYGYLLRIFTIRSVAIKESDLPPSKKNQLLAVHDKIEEDLLILSSVLYYTEERVFNEVVLPSAEKIISLSDETAAFIKKGQRNAVIGYKPQLAQSEKGFVTALIIEPGNKADSDNLFPLAKQHKENTGVTPKFISADDGYSSKAGRDKCLEKLKVENVCLSGAVGKKITPADLWDSELYIDGRKKRSAVESLMFTLKYVFNFGQLRRRGIENVRAEMLEKITAYNIRKKIEIEEQSIFQELLA